MDRQEQIRQEKEWIAHWEEELELRTKELERLNALRAADISNAIDRAYARLGVRSAQEMLHVHQASLDAIERRVNG